MGQVSDVWIMTGVGCFALLCTTFGALASSVLYWRRTAGERAHERDAARAESARLSEDLRREQAFNAAQLAELVKRHAPSA